MELKGVKLRVPDVVVEAQGIHSMELKGGYFELAWGHPEPLHESIQWNWKTPTLSEALTETDGNPFNGIERLERYGGLLNPRPYVLESIQWNWKRIFSQSLLFPQPYESIQWNWKQLDGVLAWRLRELWGIHSMELKDNLAAFAVLLAERGESIQWNWKLRSRLWSGLGVGLLESIQWNWKITWFTPTPITLFSIESIQWNWKRH